MEISRWQIINKTKALFTSSISQLCVCSGYCVSYPVHLEAEEAHLEAGACWTDAFGSAPVRPGPVCCV